MLCITAPCGKA